MWQRYDPRPEPAMTAIRAFVRRNIGPLTPLRAGVAMGKLSPAKLPRLLKKL
jgi:hypothetical protein